MKNLLAILITAAFLLSSQAAFAFSIKISSIKKQPAVASFITTKSMQILTLDIPKPLPDLSATFISDPVTGIDDAIDIVSSINPTTLSNASAVPVPAAAWLLGSGLIGLFGFSKKKSLGTIRGISS